jgi:hypothetical protein
MTKVLRSGIEVQLRGGLLGYFTPAQFAALVPKDGDEAFMVVDAANGVIWRLRYNAASASAFKWEYAGGADAHSGIDTSESTASAPSVDLATIGPSFTIPRPGDYLFELSARASNSTPGWGALFGLAKNGTLLGINHGITNIGGNGSFSLGTAFHKVTGLLAGDVIKLMYSNNGGGTASFDMRRLRGQPIRLG